MKLLRQDVSLRPYHTLAAEARARYVAEVHSVADLETLLHLPIDHRLVLGAGSNVLFAEDFSGLVLRNVIGGISVLDQDTSSVIVAAGGGVNWHDLVSWSIAQGYGGLQNLALIPGTVGAAPVQNIGAYGVEFDSVFEWLSAVDLTTGERVLFSAADCAFGYRHSAFKGALQDRYLIERVALRLSVKEHELVLNYGEIPAWLEEHGISQPDIGTVRDAVVSIRQSKLPDPTQLGNAGSFFKNPVITADQFEGLLTLYPDVPGYAAGEDKVKVPAGWLIERAGWKGFRQGDAGVYPRHALVLVNYGQATGMELCRLADTICASVFEIFGIVIEPEVRIIRTE